MGFYYTDLSEDNTRFPKKGSKVWEWLLAIGIFAAAIIHFGWPWEEHWDVYILLGVATFSAERIVARAFARGDRLVGNCIYRVRKVDDPCLSNARYFPTLEMAVKDVKSWSTQDLVIEWKAIGSPGLNWQRMCRSEEEAKLFNENFELENSRRKYLER